MNFIKKIFNKTNFSITVLLIIGILIMVNFFSSKIFYRFDMTQNKDYSISAVTKKAVSNLDDLVNIKAYFSSDLPAQLITLRQEVGDILDEYEVFSGGKVKTEFKDPKTDSQMEQEALNLGIPRLQFNALEKDKYQVVNGYLGIAISYGSKNQIIPVVQDTKNLEYQITSVIKKLTSQKLPVVAFWQGNGCLNVSQEVSSAYKKLGEVYEVKAFNLSDEKEKTVPADINTLIIAGPKEKFSDNELKAIDKFLVGGGSLLVMADGVKVGQNLTAEKNDLGLNKILENYGLKINNDLVMDQNNGMAAFSQGFITFTASYPLWPKIIKSGFDQGNAAVAKLESLILPWASSISVDKNKIGDKKISFLAQTTEKALAQTENYVLNPQADFLGAGQPSKFNLAVSVVGKFTDPFNSNAVPDKVGRLIMVGDSDFIADGFLGNSPDNLLFFQNIVDSLSLDQDLINIRSKGITERPLKELTDIKKNLYRYLNIFGITFLVVLFGMGRYFFRRRSNNYIL